MCVYLIKSEFFFAFKKQRPRKSNVMRIFLVGFNVSNDTQKNCCIAFSFPFN